MQYLTLQIATRSDVALCVHLDDDLKSKAVGSHGYDVPALIFSCGVRLQSVSAAV